MELDKEPFLKGFLECKKLFALNNLRYRARISVPNTYLLMGVVDETGILGPDQIYVQTSNIIYENNKPFKKNDNKEVKRVRKVWTGQAGDYYYLLF